MTSEDKQLLLADLCARLSYFTMAYVTYKEGSKTMEGNQPVTTDDIDMLYESVEAIEEAHYTIKPYLRPMSSMTEEEKEELKQEHVKDEKLYAECLTKAANGDDSMRGKVIPHFAADWCNKNHFDYRGLIPMGLALEAPEGMYKAKQ